MRIKNNHTCIICGSKYTYCPNCSEFDNYPRWMGVFCSENCHDIFNVANDFAHGLTTKERAKEILKDKDLSMRNKYRDGVEKAIDEILSGDQNTNKAEESQDKKPFHNYEKKNNEFKKQTVNKDTAVEKTETNKVQGIKNFDNKIMNKSFNKKDD